MNLKTSQVEVVIRVAPSSTMFSFVSFDAGRIGRTGADEDTADVEFFIANRPSLHIRSINRSNAINDDLLWLENFCALPIRWLGAPRENSGDEEGSMLHRNSLTNNLDKR